MSEANQTVETIFNAARALPMGPERNAYLDQACGGNVSLRKDVELMLGAASAADGFFAEKPVGLTDLDLTVVDTGTIKPRAIMEGPGTVIGRYKLLQKIGEGGMGVVYMADQEEPVRRRVALKIIKLGMDTRQVVARFEAERQALAMMDHPNIARVLDGGATETGRPYFVMELVQGVPITEFCDKNKLTAKERMGLFVQVCQAIQSAHQKGIIHRDIKPSNVLVTLHHGEPMPKVIDFGIAKATNQKLTEKTLFTQHATMIGTPAYMSPEQAEMTSMDVDTRTDVYSLGVLLYELMTGTTPFPEKRLRSLGYGEMQRVIVDEEPERPSTRLSTMADEQKTAVARNHAEELASLSKLLRGDLDWVVMRCLEKDRRRRYDTPNELVADIERHLKNEPVVARPPSASYRFQKLVRRNKLAFGAFAAIATVLVLGVIVSTWQAVRATQAKREAVDAQRKEAEQREAAENNALEALQAKEEAQAQRNVAVQQRKFRDMQLALQIWEDGDLQQANELIEASRPEPGQVPTFEWRYLRKLCRDQSIATFGDTNHQYRSAHFYDSNLLLLNDEKKLTLHDLSRRTNLLLLEDQDGISSPALCSGNTNLLATLTDDGRIKVWDLAAKRVRFAFEETPRSSINAITFSRDGRWLASASSDNSVKLWDVEARNSKPRTLHRYASQTSDVVFSSDGKHLFSGGSEPMIRTWDVATGAEAGHPLEDHTSWVFALAMSPDGLRLASGSSDSTVIVWDLNSRQRETKFLGHNAAVHALAFSPDQRTLASGARDRTIRLWDTKTGQQISVLRGHEADLKRLNFSPDGQLLVSQSNDGLIKLWKTTPALKDNTLTGGRILLKEVTFSRDGRHVAAIETANVGVGLWGTYLWDLSSGGRTRLNGHTNMVVNAAFSPDGKILATGSHDQTVKLWDVNDGKDIATLTNSFPVGSLAFSPDGRTLIVGGSKLHFLVSELGGLQFWDVPSRQATGTIPGASNIVQIALSANGTLLATGHQDGTVSLWDAQTRQRVHRFEGVSVGLVYSLAISPTEPLLAAGDMGGNIVLYNTTTREVVRPPVKAHTARVYSLAFSPDGRTLASGGQGGGLKLWNVALLQVALTLKANGQSVAFARDGNFMATSGAGVWLWPAATLEEANADAKAKNQ